MPRAGIAGGLILCSLIPDFPMTQANQQITAITAADEVSPLGRWDALASQIAIAQQNAPLKSFDYRNKAGNKAARSWIRELRKIKASIEKARKEAKAVHLERGKAVDEQAKLLEGAIMGLIEPHQSAIDEIEAEEQARIDGHRAVLDQMAALAEGITSSAEAQARLAELRSVDVSGLEEFTAEAQQRQQAIADWLTNRAAELQQWENQQAEIKRLQDEAAARDDAARIEAAQRQAVEEVEQREREALAAAELAKQGQEQAEQRAREAQEQAAAAQAAEVARLAAEAERERQAAEAQEQRRDAFRAELLALLSSSNPQLVADALVAGTFHRAVAIDWSRV